MIAIGRQRLVHPHRNVRARFNGQAGRNGRRRSIRLLVALLIIRWRIITLIVRRWIIALVIGWWIALVARWRPFGLCRNSAVPRLARRIGRAIVGTGGEAAESASAQPGPPVSSGRIAAGGWIIHPAPSAILVIIGLLQRRLALRCVLVGALRRAVIVLGKRQTGNS